MGKVTHYKEIGYIGVCIRKTLDEAEEVLQRARAVQSSETLSPGKKVFVKGYVPDIEAMEALLKKLKAYADRLLTTRECCLLMLLLTELLYYHMALQRMLDLLNDKRVDIKVITVRKKAHKAQQDRRDVREEE